MQLVAAKETKRTIRYEQEEHPWLMIYVPKQLVNELGGPDRLTLTLEPAAPQLARVA